MRPCWREFTQTLAHVMAHVAMTDGRGQALDTEDGMRLWHDMGDRLRGTGGCLFLAGNGASSSMCSHFAADLNKNARLRTQIFTDAALLTALGNDICFERVFAEPLLRMGREGDLLLTISSSGNSPNILEAIGAARERGMGVVTLSGMSPDNRSRRMGDLNIYAPGSTYGMVETAHAALLHCWSDMLTAPAAPAEH